MRKLPTPVICTSDPLHRAESLDPGCSARIVLRGDDSAAPMIFAAELLLEQAGVRADLDVEIDPSAGRGLFLPGGVGVPLEKLVEVFSAVSLEREMATRRTDRHGRFDETKIYWSCSDPWVSRLALELKRDLVSAGLIDSSSRRELRVIITHDVDWVTPTEPVSIVKSIVDRRIDGQRTWCRFMDTMNPKLLLRNLENLLALERRCGVRPWFFMLSGSYGFGRFSNRYDIRWGIAREMVAMIRRAGGVIGLHGSYHARDRGSYLEESDRLAGVVGAPVVAHRNHYLRFDPASLWNQLEKAGIHVDFSLGFTRRVGFRIPVAGPFRPFDWSRQRTANVLSIPTIAMDRPWWLLKMDDMFRELESALAKASEVSGTVAILFHPEVIVFDENWLTVFESVLELCRSRGAKLDCGFEDIPALNHGSAKRGQ